MHLIPINLISVFIHKTVGEPKCEIKQRIRKGTIMLKEAFKKCKNHNLNYPFIMPRIDSGVKKAGVNLSTLNLNQLDGRVEEIIKNKVKEEAMYVCSSNRGFIG